MNNPVLKTLVVDDEQIARQVLLEELESLPGILVIGEAENGKDALQKIAELQPDLVFLDLQMPVMGGFEVIRKLGEGHIPAIVIVTAFDEHAIQAFEAGTIDYLLKPVRASRLHKTVERAWELRRKPLERANAVAAITAAIEPANSAASRKVVGQTGSEYFLLDPDEILCFRAEGELVWIVTAKQRLLATQTLRIIEERFNGCGFERVHRNAIVNVNHIRKMSAMSSQRWLITLSNGLQVLVSKRQAHNIRKLLHW